MLGLFLVLTRYLKVVRITGPSGSLACTYPGTIHSIMRETCDGHACIMDLFVVGQHKFCQFNKIFLPVPSAPMEIKSIEPLFQTPSSGLGAHWTPPPQ